MLIFYWHTKYEDNLKWPENESPIIVIEKAQIC